MRRIGLCVVIGTLLVSGVASYAPVRTEYSLLSSGAIRAQISDDDDRARRWIVNGVDGLTAHAGAETATAASNDGIIGGDANAAHFPMLFIPGSTLPSVDDVLTTFQSTPLDTGWDGLPPTASGPTGVALTGGGIGGPAPAPARKGAATTPPIDSPTFPGVGGGGPGGNPSINGPTAVPEPASLSLLGVLVLAMRRPHRNCRPPAAN